MSNGLNSPMAGYEMIVGTKKEIILDRQGPTSYANTGTFITSGDIISAADLGWGGIEQVDADGVSQDGLNGIWIEYRGDIKGNAVPLVALHWTVLATSAEVANAVNLSTKTIRIRLRGV